MVGLFSLSFGWLLPLFFFRSFLFIIFRSRIYYGCYLDKLSFLIVLLTLWLFLALLFLRFKYHIILDGGIKFYVNNILALVIFLAMTFSIKNLLGFYIFFEISLVPLVIMIIGWGYQVERVQARFYLFLYTVVGSLPLLLVLFSVENFFRLMWPVRDFFVG